MNDSPITQNFKNIISDFYSDLSNTFPEIKNDLTPILSELEVIKSLKIDDISELDNIPNLKNLFEFCKNIYPERFFDLLYKNDDIFTNDTIDTEFLPGIDFKILWKKDISDNTKSILWKYLQLICFSIIKNENDDGTFRDTAALFETIDENELKKKLKETMEQMSNVLSESTETSGDSSDTSGGDENIKTNLEDLFGDSSNNIPDPDKLHEHITGLLGGKLGRLASEIQKKASAI